MTDRILFYLDIDLIHFGIAKYLSDKIDCELYAIVDINAKAKKFFLEQDLISFKKIWYLRDYISNIKKDPDIEYLHSFEKKYGINLFNIIYTERFFTSFNQYYTFTKNEILIIIENLCKMFESVLEEARPDFMIIKTTDILQNHLFHQICMQMGIKTLMYGLASVGYRATIVNDINKLDNASYDSEEISKCDRSIEEIESYFKGHNKFEEQLDIRSRSTTLAQRLKSSLRYLSLTFNPDFRNYYWNYGRNFVKIIIKQTSYLLKKTYRESYINKNFLYEIKEDKPFIFFPMHAQPERAIDLVAPYFTNQVEAITRIAKSLPVGYKLYVKEHVNQAEKGWREISYYKKILELPNVKLLHPSLKPDLILQKCSLVITIAGSVGLEATLYKKPTIVFTDVRYSSLPSVYRLKSIEELPEAIKLSLQKKVDYTGLNHLINLIDKDSFKFDVSGFRAEFFNHFFYAGFLEDTEISEQKMRSFLEQHKTKFEQLADEHIKKINYFKKISKLY